MNTIDEVLKELFDQKNIDNKLKSSRKRFKDGTLGIKSKISIIEKYTEFDVEIICKPKDQVI